MVRPASFSQQDDESLGGTVDVGRGETLRGAAVDEFFRSHADHQRVVLGHQLEHGVQLSRDAATELRIGRPLFERIVDVKSAAMKLDRRIVEGDRYVGGFLDRRNQVGQEIEHFLRVTRIVLRAVDVEREIVAPSSACRRASCWIGGEVADCATPAPRANELFISSPISLNGRRLGCGADCGFDGLTG